MKPRQLLLGAALLVAAGLAFFGDKTPDSGVAEAVVRAGVPARPAPSGKVVDAQIVRLVPRARLIGDGLERADARDTLFLSHNWTPPPPAAVPAPPPPPPSAPPLPFTYLGKALGDGAWEVYLARAERIYIVRNSTVIDGMYRIDAIAPPSMTLTYLPLNQVQRLNIGVFD